jgi:alpha-glucosidase (family GH31 glycosyl hydrolase)
MTGADICGFFGNTTNDLCAQWYSIGAFYPFSRNHNDIASNEQEPWIFQGNYIGVIRQAMVNKLSLIRYYHTEMLKVSLNRGSFFKPLFFTFPNDLGAYKAQIYNAMAGDSLKLAFNSEAIQDNTDFYYP